jgi:hypothetical protein
VLLNEGFMDVRLDLYQLLDLGWYSGYMLDYVVVRVRNADRGNQELTLTVNGFMEDRIRPYAWESLMRVYGLKRIDRDVFSVGLEIEGYVEIESITAHMTRY